MRREACETRSIGSASGIAECTQMRWHGHICDFQTALGRGEDSDLKLSFISLCHLILAFHSIFVFFLFWLHRTTFRILAPPPGIEPTAVKLQSPNPWPARESPLTVNLKESGDHLKPTTSRGALRPYLLGRGRRMRGSHGNSPRMRPCLRFPQKQKHFIPVYQTSLWCTSRQSHKLSWWGSVNSEMQQ